MASPCSSIFVASCLVPTRCWSMFAYFNNRNHTENGIGDSRQSECSKCNHADVLVRSIVQTRSPHLIELIAHGLQSQAYRNMSNRKICLFDVTNKTVRKCYLDFWITCRLNFSFNVELSCACFGVTAENTPSFTNADVDGKRVWSSSRFSIYTHSKDEETTLSLTGLESPVR